MKKLVIVVSAMFLLGSLSACASSMGSDDMGDNMKIKCPACGHEFTAQDTNR